MLRKVLSALVDTHYPGLAEEWHIPVSVVGCPGGAPDVAAATIETSGVSASAHPASSSAAGGAAGTASGPRTVIFLEKPLLKRKCAFLPVTVLSYTSARYTLRRKNEIYYNAAFKSLSARPGAKQYVLNLCLTCLAASKGVTFAGFKNATPEVLSVPLSGSDMKVSPSKGKRLSFWATRKT
jgi:hypothetical protein